MNKLGTGHLAALCIALSLATVTPSAADVFEDHMHILCRALRNKDLDRVAGVLKTPYVLPNMVFPSGWTDCLPSGAPYSMLAHVLKFGDVPTLRTVLAAGAVDIVSSNATGSEGRPLTWAQSALASMYSTDALPKFEAFWDFWKSSKGASFVRAELAKKNGSGKDALQWLCTQHTNSGPGGLLWWESIYKQIPGGNKIAGFIGNSLGYSNADIAALCKGWTP